MIEIYDHPKPIQEEVTIRIIFEDGNTFVQPITIDEIDMVQDFMDWYRKPGVSKVWTWHAVTHSSIHMISHSKILAVDIEGYIEPEGRSSRWLERIIDKFRILRM